MNTDTITPSRPAWRGTMSARERFDAQMHYRPFDRCFNREFGYWQENYETWPGFVANGIKTEGQADFFFSFDPMPVIGGSIWMCPPFEQRVLTETDEVRVLINADGLTAETPRDGHSTIPHYTGSSIITPDDWRQVKEERFQLDRPERRVDVDALLRQHPAHRDYPLGVHCGSMIGKIRDMLTLEGLAYAIHDYPAMLEDMVETTCQLVEGFLDQVLDRFDFDFASGWEDICFRGGPIVSLDFFDNVVVPRYERIGRRLADSGIDIWFTDCDGDVRPLLPGMLRSGMNTLFPFEVHSSGHPGPLLDKYGEQLRILGGFDKFQLAAGPQAIRNYMEGLVPYVERGGFIPFCDHRCPPDVSYDDYLFYLDLKEQLFGM